MKIGIRLSLGFGIIMSLLVLLAGISINRVNLVDRNLTTMNDINSVKQRYAINFRGSVHNRAIALRDVILVQNPAELPAVLSDIDKLTDDYQKSAGPLDAMLMPDAKPSAEELSIIASIKATEQKTLPLIKSVIARQRAGDLSGATSQLMQEARPQFNEWLKEINQFIDLQEAMNKSVATATRATTDSFQWLLILLCVGGLAIAAGVAFWSMKAVRLLPSLTGVMESLAQGDRTVAIPSAGMGAELNDLGSAMVRFRDQLVALEASKAEQVEMLIGSVGTGLDRLSKGDLTSRIDSDLTGPFAKLKTDFNTAMGELQGVMKLVAQSANGIHTGAGEISQASDDLSRRTEQQAASLEETAASMDEITATVKEAATNAARTNTVVGETRSEAEQSGQVVRRAIDAMHGIERSSSEISEIIAVIDGIAFQTNLLALNAGVEAARAGDAGKGFAVVASEVRALAQRSADAAKDVKSKITASSQQVDVGVDLVTQTGNALDRIVARIGEISGLVSGIASSAQQQAAGVQQVNAAVGEMDGVTQQNAAMVEEATAAARSLSSKADELARQIARFELGDGGEHATAAPVRKAAPVQPVHALQNRVANAARRAAPRSHGNTALKQEDDWSEF